MLGSTSPAVANAAAYKTHGVQHELTGVLVLPWAALNQLIHTCLCRALVVDDQVTTAAGESKEVGTVAQSELASLDIGDAQFRAWRWHTAIGRSDMAMLSNLDFPASMYRFANQEETGAQQLLPCSLCKSERTRNSKADLYFPSLNLTTRHRYLRETSPSAPWLS
jgi:hypothetical protein